MKKSHVNIFKKESILTVPGELAEVLLGGPLLVKMLIFFPFLRFLFFLPFLDTFSCENHWFLDSFLNLLILENFVNFKGGKAPPSYKSTMRGE